MLRKPSWSQWVHLVRRVLGRSSLAGLLLWTVSTAQVQTDITPDGTMGTEVTQTGTIHDITGGTRPGNGQNLFHSFDRFSVGTGDTARFGSDPGVDNIISRITGGAESMIDGTLQAEANLFLLNPQGIMFGPNATLNVNGSFHASTADELRFADGATFSARLSERTTLTVAAPSAFGFLSENPAGITIADSQLEVPDGESLSIIGGNIRIVGDSDPWSGAPTISAPGGRVSLVSVASSGEVGFNPTSQRPELEVGSFDQLGEIVIAEGALIDVSGEGGGTVVIQGGQLLIDQSFVFADTLGEIDSAGLGVDLQVRGEAVIANGSSITTDVLSIGNAGDIRIRAGNLEVRDEALIGSRAFGPGDGGDIHVTTGNLQIERLSFIVSRTDSEGDAGDVTVEADNITMLEGSQINSLTRGPGHGGNVSVRATNVMTLSGTSEDGRFPSGIFVQALGDAQDAGDAGDVTISAGSVQILEGSRIDTRTLGPGRAGAITLMATNIRVAGEGTRIDAGTRGEGPAGSILLEVDRLTIIEGAQISTTTRGLGPGGTLTVIADESIDIIDESGGEIRSGLFSNSGEGEGGEPTGNAGDIVIKAPRLIVNGGRILTRTLGDGNAGNITIEVDRLELLGGGQIFNGIGNAQADNTVLGNPDGEGHGGTLKVTARESIVISGRDSAGFSSGLFSSAQIGLGQAGDILVETLRLEMRNGGKISTASGSRSSGDAGDLTVDVGTLVLRDGAQIASSTFGPGNGGRVTVRATEVTLEGADPDNPFPSGIFASAAGDREGDGAAGAIVVEAEHLSLSGGAQIVSATFGSGNGGTVTVRATEVTLEGVASDNRFPSGIFASAEGDAAGAGDAGDIVVAATSLSLSGGAQISSGTFGPGNGGTVTVTATDTITVAGQNSGIFANATGDGQGGDMTLHGSQLLLTDGAAISAQSSGQGNAGTIQIAVSDLILRDHSVVTTEATQAGGGNIEIEAQTVSLLDSDISATVRGGEGSGGNILIGGAITDHGDITTGVESITLEGSRITANTDAGDGANIAIGVQQAVLDSRSEIAANTDAGVGGNVTIAGTVAVDGQALTRAEAIVLRASRITAQADEGKGGRIDIVAEAVLADPDSEIDASSQAGIDGEVNIEAVSTNLSEIVTPLSPRFTQTAALLSDPCASRLQRGIVSSFIARGRDSVPATPDGLLPSRLYSRAIDPAKPESAGPREALTLNSHVQLSRRPCP